MVEYSYWDEPVVSDSAPVDDDDFFAGYNEAKAFVLVPAGKYIAVLTGWDKCKNSNGTKYLKFSYRIQEGEFSGQVVTGQQYVTKNSMPYVVAFFESLKINPEKTVADYPEIFVELVTVIQDGKDGRKYANVVSVRRIVLNSSPAPVAPVPAAPVAPAPAPIPVPAENGVPGGF